MMDAEISSLFTSESKYLEYMLTKDEANDRDLRQNNHHSYDIDSC